MAFTKGELEVLYIKKEGTFFPIGCLTSNGFTESVDTSSTTTRGSNGWRTFVPTNQQFEITFEGLHELVGSIITYDDLVTMKRNRERIEWALFRNGTKTDEGFGYITDLGKTSAVGEFISFTGNILGYGEPVVVIDTALFQDGTQIQFQDGTNMIFN